MNHTPPESLVIVVHGPRGVRGVQRSTNLALSVRQQQTVISIGVLIATSSNVATRIARNTTDGTLRANAIVRVPSTDFTLGVERRIVPRSPSVRVVRSHS
jgi:hypothetical protein